MKHTHFFALIFLFVFLFSCKTIPSSSYKLDDSYFPVKIEGKIFTKNYHFYDPLQNDLMLEKKVVNGQITDNLLNSFGLANPGIVNRNYIGRFTFKGIEHSFYIEYCQKVIYEKINKVGDQKSRFDHKRYDIKINGFTEEINFDSIYTDSKNPVFYDRTVLETDMPYLFTSFQIEGKPFNVLLTYYPKQTFFFYEDQNTTKKDNTVNDLLKFDDQHFQIVDNYGFVYAEFTNHVYKVFDTGEDEELTYQLIQTIAALSFFTK